MDVLTKCRAHPPPSRWSWLQRKNRETKMSQWFQLLHIIHHSSRSSLHMSVCDHDSRHWPFHWEEMYVETSTRSNHRVGNCNLSLWRASWVRWWTGAGESCTLPMKLKVDLLLVSQWVQHGGERKIMQKHETPAFSLPTFPFSVQNLEPYVVWQTWDDSRKFRWPWLDVPVVELAVCFQHCAQRRNETWSLASRGQHHLLQAAPVAFQHVSCLRI